VVMLVVKRRHAPGEVTRTVLHHSPGVDCACPLADWVMMLMLARPQTWAPCCRMSLDKWCRNSEILQRRG